MLTSPFSFVYRCTNGIFFHAIAGIFLSRSFIQKVSECDQATSQSHTADQPTAQ